MNTFEKEYRDLVAKILLKGNKRETRNAVTQAIFGEQLVIDSLNYADFPIVTGRKMYWKGVAGEMAAFLKGPKHINDFEKEGCNYWKNWANKDGSINVDYGNAWLDFNGVNQLKLVSESLKQDPNGRRHLITSWRPDRINGLSLPCCHYAYQWFVVGNQLDMIWIQRSVDVMIGLPSDIILAAIFNILMANEVGLKPGNLVFQMGDCHIYESHINGAYTYLCNPILDLPSYSLTSTIWDYKAEDLQLIGYCHQDPIKFELL